MIISKQEQFKIIVPELRASLAGIKYPAFVEEKYDGEFCNIIYDEKETPKIHTVNKYGTTRWEFDILRNIANILWFKTQSCVLLGELYFETGLSGSLYKLLSHKTDNNLQIKLFDIAELNNVNLCREPLIVRKEVLFEIMNGKHQIIPKLANDEYEVSDIHSHNIHLGYEGSVVKPLDSILVPGPCSWAKIKHKDRTDYVVAIVDQTQERIEVMVPNVNGKPATFVGVKAPNRYKKHIKFGDLVTIEHQGVLESGSLRHPVLIPRKEWK